MDTNSNNELAVVKLSTHGRHELKDYLQGKSKYKAIIEIENDEGKRIKIDGVKFVENSPRKDLSEKSVEQMKYDCLNNPKTSRGLRKENKAKIKSLKK